MTNAPFNVTPTPPTSIKLAPGQEGQLSFTITSLAAPGKVQELTLQALLVGADGKGEEVDWLVVGPRPSLTMVGGETETVTITARPKAASPRGENTIRLVIADRDRPHDVYAYSPSVVCEVVAPLERATPAPKKRAPWWLIPAIVGGLLVVGGTALGIRALIHDGNGGNGGGGGGGGGGGAACTAGERKCTPDGAGVLICSDDGNWKTEPCAGCRNGECTQCAESRGKRCNCGGTIQCDGTCSAAPCGGICVAGRCCALDTGTACGQTVWRHTGAACSDTACLGWEALDDDPSIVAIAATTRQLYKLHDNGEVWGHTGTPCNRNACPGWEKIDNSPRTRSISAHGASLYKLHDDGSLWRYTGTPCIGKECPGWEQLDNNPRTKSIAGIHQLRSDGSVWRWSGKPCSGGACPDWLQVDNNPETRSIAGSSGLYQLRRDGSILKHVWDPYYQGPNPCSYTPCRGWEQIVNADFKVKSLVAGGSDLYQLHGDGAIWRYTPGSCKGTSCWELLLGPNPRTKSIAAGEGPASLYQLQVDGSIWRYTGTPCSGSSCPGWEKIDNTPRAKSIVAGGVFLYQLQVP